jgi:alpha-galactosidase
MTYAGLRRATKPDKQKQKSGDLGRGVALGRHPDGQPAHQFAAVPRLQPQPPGSGHLTHLLLPDDGRMARLWDVRLPEARSHLAAICGRLVADHHLDGLKIDFIDQWSSYPSTPTPAAADTSSYTVGVDRLLAAIVTQLQAVVDNPMIEFRQPYSGPRMMRYGNMFRVADCPADGFRNRVSSLDLRHVIKERAVHADMVMWAATDPAEDAAEQLLCTAFLSPTDQHVVVSTAE